MVETIGSLVTSLLPQIISGGTVGFMGGWLAKKVVKVVMYVLAFVTGLFALGIGYAESQGWVTVTIHWDAISASGQTLLTSAINSLGPILASVTAFTGPLGIMFYAGFKKG
jgi:uncharacterized membrane protein (Fun14 family)